MIGWSRLAHLVRRRPGRVFLVSFLLLALPAGAVARTRVTYDELSELPPRADSVRGYALLSRHFERGRVSPLSVVVRARRPVWTDEGFRALNDLTVALSKVPGVAVVRSLVQPTGGRFTEADLARAGLGDLAAFPDRLAQGADGVAQVIGGLGRIREGLVRIRDELPALADGLARGAAGVAETRDGVRQMRDGVGRLRAGLLEAADALSRPGARNDLSDLAADAAARSLEAFRALRRPTLPTTLADPSVRRALVEIGTVYGDLTGRDPRTGRPGAGDRDAERYAAAGGMAGSLRSIAAGLRDAAGGLGQLDAGLAALHDALARLGPGLGEGAAGVRQTVDGVRQMIDGVDRILPGLERLRGGLAEGAARVRSAGLGDIVSAGNLGLTPALVESVPGLRDQLGVFVSADRRTTRLLVTLEREPYASASLDAVDLIRRQARLALRGTVLQGADVLVTGPAAFFEDVRTLSRRDLPTIVTAVLLGIFVVLVLLLRSVVAPVYLILTVLLSLAATLGLTTLVFQVVLGQPGLAWWLPTFLFVMLVALGADYNIFLMSRIREEARTRTTADATARGLALTGHVITSAGLILAGTFAALLGAPLRSLQQFGFAVTVGILLDTFVVRTLLVPSIAMLLGRHNWWPSRRAHAS
jgi:RND superfamily putative drug exporter